MRTFIHIFILSLLLISGTVRSQITTPVIRANFGVDADLRANYYNGFVQSGNDDWFNNGTPGTGQFVIDTTGAAYIVNRYTTDLNFRKQPFFRTMRFPEFSIINNRLLIDAVFIRDYHGDDSTTFNGGNKNGMSPQNWSCPVSQSVPDKTEILDMMVHVRRAGPTFSDSLWMFGGISIENTTGNRYFDFEMYQTDIFYDRASQQFFNYGPDAGHTSWDLDASGNVVIPGDIIFTAEFGSSSLTNLEARIWVNKNTMSITPANFDWTGTFDGASAGATFGYAGIKPKTAGAFYTGLQSNNGVWAGPFNLIRTDNSIATSYTARQYMEISINLTKLGLDPVTLLGGEDCGMPFRRVLTKTRSSTSFTSELKDFVGPFDLFLAPVAEAAADIPVLCDDAAVSTISVTNASPTSVYTWTTADGNILTSPAEGPSILVDQEGTYIVTQRLQTGCSVYATDTVVVLRDYGCQILKNGIVNFRGVLQGDQALLSWMADKNNELAWFELERSENGIDFTTVGKIDAKAGNNTLVAYSYADNLTLFKGSQVYYRLKIKASNGVTTYSSVIRLGLSGHQSVGITISPNPVRNQMQINIYSAVNQSVNYRIMDGAGRTMYSSQTTVVKGSNSLIYDEFESWAPGVYLLQVSMGGKTYNEKFVLNK